MHVIDHIFSCELRDAPEFKERMTQLLFDASSVPSRAVAIRAFLALYASGRTTGMVPDSCVGVSLAAPVYTGYALPPAIRRLHLISRDPTEYVLRRCTRHGFCHRDGRVWDWEG